jgi:polyisoprenyl-phosphate glycosyltransferase
MMAPVSVVIPAYNEEASIYAVVEHVQQVLSGAGVEHEIVVVDDGSGDQTAVQASHAQVVVRHPQNLGYGRSLKSGILAAHHDVIAILDADNSYPAERLPEMLGLAESFHMVSGARTGRIYHGGLVKRIGRFFFRRLAEFAAGQKIPDINSGMRVFRRHHVLPLFPLISGGFSFTTTLTLVYLLNDLFVYYLPIEYHRRAGRSKVHHIRDSLRALQIIVEAILRCNPIKLFLLLAVPFVLAGLGLGIAAVAWNTWAAAIASLLAFGLAGLLFGMGCLAVAVMPTRRGVVDQT